MTKIGSIFKNGPPAYTKRSFLTSNYVKRKIRRTWMLDLPMSPRAQSAVPVHKIEVGPKFQDVWFILPQIWLTPGSRSRLYETLTFVVRGTFTLQPEGQKCRTIAKKGPL